MDAGTWRVKNSVEAKAEAAGMGQSLHKWWAGRASINITGQRKVQGMEVMFQHADDIPFPLSLGSTSAGLQAFSLC